MAAPVASKGRVLIVDDSRFVREFVSQILRHAGYEVEQAEDGGQALRRLDAETFDVIVTDLNMPALDGFAVLETIKLRDLSSEVVILTGSHAKDMNAAVRALRLGAHDYLTKPLCGPDQADQAILTIERAIEKKRQREALREYEQRYRTLFDRVPVALYRSRQDGQILDVNPAMTQLLGYPSREALLQKNARDLYVHAADREHWQESLSREGVLNRFNVVLRRHDGSEVRVEENARAVNDTKSQVTYYDGCLVETREGPGAQPVPAARVRALTAALDAALTALTPPTLNDERIRAAVDQVRSAAELARSLLVP